MVFWKKLLLLPLFFGKKCKKKHNVFEDKWFLSKMFSQIEMQMATNWYRYLKKHQTFVVVFSNDRFLTQFSKILFSEIFENHL